MMVVTGGTGRLGKTLRARFPAAAFPSRRELNLCVEDSVEQYIRRHRPTVFIHAAAMTDVREAETHQSVCWDTNVTGTERLVEALNRYSPACYFIYVSTACVFQGDRGDYSEVDLPNPKNFYGLTKLVAEYVVRRMQKYLIVRTNFVAHEPWRFPRAFVDRFGTYLYADDVATALRSLVDQHSQGVVHIAGDQRMSMFDLAKLTTPEVEPLSVKEVSLPLTIDMTLCSLRIAPMKIGSGGRPSNCENEQKCET